MKLVRAVRGETAKGTATAGQARRAAPTVSMQCSARGAARRANTLFCVGSACFLSACGSLIRILLQTSLEIEKACAA